MEEKKEVIDSVKLKYPIKFGGQEITIIDFLRRPQARDLKGLDLQNLKMEDQCKILANITNAEYSQLLRCDMVDMIVLSGKVTDFLGDGPETGEES